MAFFEKIREVGITIVKFDRVLADIDEPAAETDEVEMGSGEVITWRMRNALKIGTAHEPDR